MDSRAHLDRRERQELPVSMEKSDLLDLPDPLDKSAILVQEVQWDRKDSLAHKVVLEHQVHKDLKAFKDRLDRRDRLDHNDPKVLPEDQDPLDPQVLTVTEVPLVLYARAPVKMEGHVQLIPKRLLEVNISLMTEKSKYI